MGSNKVMDRSLGMGNSKATTSIRAMDRGLGMDSSKVMGSSKAMDRNLTMARLKATDSHKATRIRMSTNTSIRMQRPAPRRAVTTSTLLHQRPHTRQAQQAGETSIPWVATWKYDPHASIQHFVYEPCSFTKLEAIGKPFCKSKLNV